MALYRVRPGFEHGTRGCYKAGDIVEHTPEEAAGFADKLELVEVEPAPTIKQPTDAPVEVVPVAEQPFDVTGSTVTAVLAAVEADTITAADALAIETAGRNRATLVKALQELISGADSE